MLFTLICKKRVSDDGRKWTNYNLLRGKKWYSVKFVKDCAPPQNYKIDEGIYRAFIDLSNKDKFDLKENADCYNTIFVESYGAVTPEIAEKHIAIEKERVDKYREEKEKNKIDFITPSDEDLPF